MAKIDGSVLVDIKLNFEHLGKDLKNLNSTLINFSKKGTITFDKLVNDSGKLNKVKGNFDSTSDSVNKLKTSSILMANIAFEAIKKVISSSINLSKQIFSIGASYESAFAGVIKTVNATEAQLQDLKNAFIDMSKVMPISANELAKIGEMAGQLGIKTTNIKSFVKTMADLANATNLSSEQASTELARLANITQMAQSDFDRLGSSIVALGNNFATTESEIVSMALSIAGAGKQVGLTEAEMLAMATALSSVGIEAQAGGTAISTMLIEMKKAVVNGKGLEAIAKTANMTGEEFKKAFSDNASVALNAFIKGLSTANKRGQDALLLLEEMGINEVRLTKSLLSLSGANSILNDALKISNQAWDENTALTKEASQRYQTMESKLAMVSNSFKAIAISLYNDFQQPFKDGLDNVLDSVEDFSNEIAKPYMKKAIKELSIQISEFIKATVELAKKVLPTLIKGLSWFMANGSKVAMVFATTLTIQKAIKAYSSLTLTLKTLKTAQNNAVIAQKLLNLIMSANPYVLMATAILSVASALFIFSSKSSESSLKFKKFNEEISKGKQKIESIKKSLNDSVDELSFNTLSWQKLKDEIKGFLDVNGEVIGDKEKLKNKIDELNQAIGQTVFIYDEENNRILNQKNEIINLKDEIEKIIELKKAEAYLEATKDEYVEAIKAQTEQRKSQKELLLLINNELDKEIEKGVKAKAVYEKMLEINKLIADEQKGSNDGNKIASLTNQYLEFRKQLQDSGVDIQNVVNSFNKIKEATQNIAINQDIIDNFEALNKAVSTLDTEKAKMFLNGLSSKEIENSAKTLSDLKDKVQDFTHAKDLAIKAGDYQLAQSFDEDIKRTNELIKTFHAQLEESSKNSASNAGNSLNDEISKGMENAIDNAQNKWNSFNLEPKKAQIVIDYINNTPKGSYYKNGGSASFDDNESLAYETFNRLSSLASNVSNNINNISLNQVNNFNIPITKPSDVANAIDKINRNLARRI